MPTSKDWVHLWLSIAEQVAWLSKDPSTQVGAVIVTPDNKQCSLGYNGFPSGIKETDFRWDRPEKYEWVIHAEKNAIANCPFPTSGCSLFVTHQPCHHCLGFILNSGIVGVYYKNTYSNLRRSDIWFEIASQFPQGVSEVEK